MWGSASIDLYAHFFDTARVMLGIALFGIAGLLLGEVIRIAERRFEVWRPDVH